VIALTHVCRAWREAFVSRSPLWTDFNCAYAEKTRVYLERSKSSPINVRLYEGDDDDLSPRDPFLQIIPHAIGRLKSLVVYGTPGNLPGIVAHLCQPAPLLEYLLIDAGCESEPHRNPTLANTLFNGDLPSLRELYLQSIRTELPWRNLVNLTSFTLCNTSPRNLPIRQFLDFFESVPHLRKVCLSNATPISGAQSGRLVSLAYLERMNIIGDGPPSLLLDHLIIPVGAMLITQATSYGPLTENLLPRSLDNLRNLPDFIKIDLLMNELYPTIEFSGPNGQVCMITITPPGDVTCLVLGSLARFDTSKTERLKISRGNPLSSDPLYRALLPMKHLRTLTLSDCTSPEIFTHSLDPSMSSSGVVVCSELEELVLILRRDGETLNVGDVIEMAEARASRGAKIKTVRIVGGRGELFPVDALELKKHVWQVEYGPQVGTVGDDSDDESDESDEDDEDDEGDEEDDEED
jgi:hypothetical protein